ncbi:hypothetical protein [Thiolinea disciformis]|uniref:hypothetical protein n=1 Tax=Thiolinea disciformis TaxID=125614 RepID=UPI00036F3DA9|nr:hypothetical protein [Thiolinea disciformis]
MKKALIAFAALASVGLSACSQNPTGSSPEEMGSVNPPHSQQTTNTASSSIPQARPLIQGRGGYRAAPTPHYRGAMRPQQPRMYAGYIPPQQTYQGRPSPAYQSQGGGGMPRLSSAELRAIGEQIFNNEGGGNRDLLAHWNEGEDFASMGIGHFTWYPAGRRQSFGNTFPGLLDYLAQNGVQLPAWLQQARHQGAPWPNRQAFMVAKQTPQMQELTQILYNTRELQTQYIVDRTRRAMPKLVKASNNNMQGHVARNLNAVANTPGGWYALIDYVNFKGEGLGNGGYKGQNWGLRQVLEEMRPAQPGQAALHEFSDAAMRVLQRRVNNSDPARNEAKWLAGWRNRVETYRNPLAT